MARVEECHNFATKTKAAPVAHSAAFLVHGRFVGDTANARTVAENGLLNDALEDSKRRLMNGEKSFVCSSKTAPVFELLRQPALNVDVSTVCFIICARS